MYSTEEKNAQDATRDAINQLLEKHQISPTNKPSKLAIKSNNGIIVLDKEINLDSSKIIMSKTDARGIIEYANEYFMEISGYEEFELMGQPHNIIRHPDMPQTIFKLMWKRLKAGENIYAFVKNLAKDGRFYWVLTSFETKFDDDLNIISHYARRKAAPKNSVYTVDKLYKTLRAIELKQSLKIAENYFNGYLEERAMTYDAFILSLLDISSDTMISYFEEPNQKKKKQEKSLMKRLFNK